MTEKLHNDEIARAVGHVCLSWSDLEWKLILLASRIAKVIAPEYDNSRISFPFEITFSCTDVREKIRVIKLLAHTMEGSTTFYDDVSLVLNEIDNDLRPERNRYVHDHWWGGPEIWRIQHAPKILRPESFKRTLHRRTIRKFADTEEIFALVKRIDAAREQVDALTEQAASFPPLVGLPSK